MDILEKVGAWWSDMVNDLNSKGIPLPMVRDPKSGKGSVALTLVVISSFMVVASLIGKFSRVLEGIDISNALQFFYASSGLYWARKLNSDKKKSSDQEEPPAQS